jgi:hypothetical protein
MALPATNIALSAVNTNLGNAATAAITLDNGRVRSLGSNAGASGSAFSVSSLASKSGTFISLINSTANFTAPATSSGYYFGTQPKLADAFYSTGYDTASATAQLTKYYLNSNIRSSAAFRGVSNSVLSLSVPSSNISSTTGNLFFSAYYYTGGTPRQGILKLNTSLGFVSQIYVPSYTGSYGRIVVDSSENVYFSGYTSIDGDTSQVVLTALNPSMTTMRWNKHLTDSPISAQCVDGAGNLYATILKSGDNIPRVVKFNSSGTQLFQTTTSTGATGGVLVVNCNSSGTFAVLSNNYPVAYLTFYNSSGTFQWARSLGATSFGGGYASCVTATGDVYCASNSSASPSLFLYKFNSSGTLIWQRKFTGVINTGVTANGMGVVSQLSVLGDAEGVLTMGFDFGFNDEYDGRIEYGLLSVPTDGSGTGTYTVGGATFTYAVGSETIATVGSSANGTVALNSATIYIPQAVTPVSVSPTPFTQATVNI